MAVASVSPMATGGGLLVVRDEVRTVLMATYQAEFDALQRVDRDIYDRTMKAVQRGFDHIDEFFGRGRPTWPAHDSPTASMRPDLPALVHQLEIASTGITDARADIIAICGRRWKELGHDSDKLVRATHLGMDHALDALMRERAIAAAAGPDGHVLVHSEGLAQVLAFYDTDWTGAWERTRLRTRLGFKHVRSKDKTFELPGTGRTFRGTRFSFEVDPSVARSPDPVHRPWAVHVEGGPLGLLERAGGPLDRSVLDESDRVMDRVRRAVPGMSEKAATTAASSTAKRAATGVAAAAGLGAGASLGAMAWAVGFPLAAGLVVKQLPAAIRAINRARKGAPGPFERRAAIQAINPQEVVLQGQQRALALQPAERRERDLDDLEDVGMKALEDRMDDMAFRSGTERAGNQLMKAGKLFAQMASGARRWAADEEYPEAPYLLLLFEGGESQLVDMLWERTTA